MKYKSIILIFSGATILFSACGNENTDENSKDNPSEINGNGENKSVEISSGNTVITGTMTNGNGATIKLYSYASQQPTVLDSAVVGADGSFSIAINQNGYDFLGLGETPQNAVLLLVTGNEQLSISGKRETWALEAVISGSDLSVTMSNYFKERQVFAQKVQSLKAQMQSLPQGDMKSMEEINTQGMILQEEFDAYKYKFIKDNINSPAVYAAFQDIYDLAKDIELLKQIESTMNKFMPNSVFAEATTQKYESALAMTQQESTPPPGGLAVGKEAPELNFPGVDGKNVSLKSLQGKLVLLDFWASWCGPCRKENPNVVKLYNEFKDKGFTIYSFSLDQDKNKWIQAIEADGLIWPNHASDLKGWNSIGGALYGINSIPQTYLIGADGKIVAVGLRGKDLDDKVKEILG